MHGAFVRLAAEKIGADDFDWFCDLPEAEREWLVGTLDALGDTAASRVAAAVREMEAR